MLFSKKDTINLIIGISAVAGMSIGAYISSEIIVAISTFEAIALMYINHDIDKRRGK